MHYIHNGGLVQIMMALNTSYGVLTLQSSLYIIPTMVMLG